jgi:replicative DNA helicase|tara:strand:+ start:524 stop:1759 length:1236 start_codon:yes stop_codon:yes gene_type:complete
MKEEKIKQYFDNDLEVHIINQILWNPDLVYKFPDLDYNCFHYSETQEIFKSIQSNKGKAIFEIKKVIIEKGDEKLIKTFTDIQGYVSSHITPIDVCISLLLEYSNRRKLIEELKQTGDKLQIGEITTEQAIGGLLGNLQENKYIPTNQTISGADIFSEWFESPESQDLKRYSTGLRILDKAFEGGLEKGNVFCINGKYKSGKTTLALQSVIKMQEQGLRIKWFALEMSPQELHRKILAKYLDVDVNSLRREYLAKIKNADVRAKVARFTKQFVNNPILYQTLRGCTGDTLISQIYNAVHKEQVDVIVIDYLQLVCSNSGSNRIEFLEELSSKIMGVIKDYDLIGIVLLQLNREGYTYGTDGMNRVSDISIKIDKKEGRNMYSLEAIALRSAEDFNGEDALRNKNGTHFIEN